MTLNRKILKKLNHWSAMMVACTITCLNSCGCGPENSGGGGVKAVESSEGGTASKGKKTRSKSVQELKNEAEAAGNQAFEVLKNLSPQTPQQEAADKQAIEQLIGNLSADETVMFNFYLIALNMQQEEFVDLFSKVSKGKDMFQGLFVPGIKASLAEFFQLGHSTDPLVDVINNKKNNTVSEEERNELALMEEMVRKLFVVPLTKAATAQANNN